MLQWGAMKKGTGDLVHGGALGTRDGLYILSPVSGSIRRYGPVGVGKAFLE